MLAAAAAKPALGEQANAQANAQAALFRHAHRCAADDLLFATAKEVRLRSLGLFLLSFP